MAAIGVTLLVGGMRGAFESGKAARGPLALERMPCIANDGLGPLGDQMFVVTRSPHNELRLPRAGKTDWRGRDWNHAQLVVLWNKQVIDQANLPVGFSPGHSLIVSYQPDGIDVIDPARGTHCRYRRDLGAVADPVPAPAFP